MGQRVKVIGVGMVKFAKPGASDPYEVMAGGAIRSAIADAGLALEDVQQAYASYVFGDSACGQAALYRVGMTGIPVFNVNNNCSSGSSALYLARQAIMSGNVECALAFGFEEMRPGALGAVWQDSKSALLDLEVILKRQGPGVQPSPNEFTFFC